MSKKEIPFGFIQGNEIYLKGYLDQEDRRIGEIKENEDDSIKYFSNRFELIKAKVAQLEADVTSAENKGSYLMKLMHFREKLKSHDGLGDYVPLFEKLDELESSLRELIAVNRVRNEEIKTALLKEFEEFSRVVDWKEATEKILNIKDRWLKTGAVEKTLNQEFEDKFTSAMQDFFDRKREYVEEKRKVTEIRTIKYRSLIDSARRINPNDPGTNLKVEVEKLRDEWRAVGWIPSRDKKFLEKDFNYKISNLFKQRSRPPYEPVSEEELNKNLIAKQALLERAIELEKSDSFLELQQVQEEWQRIGLIPKESYKELTESFKTLCEKALEKRFLEQLAENKDSAYTSKNNREKTRFKISLLKDLLRRDEKDLQSFLNNMDKFNTGQKFDKVMSNKLLNQKRKVAVKRLLLHELKASLDEVHIQR